MQSIHHLLFRRNIGFGLGHLRLHASGIESGHHLPYFHVVAFLHQHFGHTLTGVEWQIRLSQIHVAIQDERVRVLVTAGQPRPRGDSDAHDGDNEHYLETGFGH
jgi:hypothetical protein